MSNKIEFQKKQLQYALACLNTIEIADDQIKRGYEKEYFETCRQEGMEGYANAIAAIVKETIVCNNLIAEA